ncbi:12755_t:CDS:2, partial [Dentiscutata erythropus]
VLTIGQLRACTEISSSIFILIRLIAALIQFIFELTFEIITDLGLTLPIEEIYSSEFMIQPSPLPTFSSIDY